MIVGEQIITDSNGNQRVFKMIQTEGANQMPDPLFKKFTIKHFQEFCDEFGATCPLLFRDVLVLLKAQPDIVRCKECKHRSKELYDYYGNPKDKRYVCEIIDVAKKPDWFCADGEREVKQMTKQMCLTQDDIQQIIASAFSVDKDKVFLEPYKDLEGYGTGEHYVAKVKATVQLPIADCRSKDGEKNEV